MFDLPGDSGLDGLTKVAALPAASGYVQPGVLVDAAGRLDQDIDCRVCGYNLRGSGPGGVCPECGTAVGWSLEGDLLKFADPDWVQKLATGMGWLLSSVVASFLLGCVGVTIANSTGRPAIVLGAPIVFVLMILVGCWLLTEPESVERISGLVRVRLVARWGCILSVVLEISSSAIGMTEPVGALVVSVMGGVVGIVGFFGLFLYARRLALRIPDKSLAKQTRIVMWSFVVLVGFGIVAAIDIAAGKRVVQGAGASPSGPVLDGLAAVGCVVGVGYLAFGIWALVLLALYRSRFSREAEHARRTWATRRAGAAANA